MQIGAIRDQISELAVSEASAGLRPLIAERAEPPDAPASPRPFRNGVLAFFGALFLGVLVALGRDQLTPRVSGPRELGRLLDLPVLVDIPYVRRPQRRADAVLSGVEVEAYQTLRSSLELSSAGDRTPARDPGHRRAPRRGQDHRHRAPRAAPSPRAGHRVLLVSADLRVPRLHELFGLPLGFGLSDILAVLDWTVGALDEALLGARRSTSDRARCDARRRRGELHVITSGTKAKDPGRLIAGPAMRAFLERVRALDYDYVLVDAPAAARHRRQPGARRATWTT